MTIKRIPPSADVAEMRDKINELVDAVNEINSQRRLTRVPLTQDVLDRIEAVADKLNMTYWGASLDMGCHPSWYTSVRHLVKAGYARSINQPTYKKVINWLEKHENGTQPGNKG